MALADGPIFFKAYGAGKGWARKKSFFRVITAKTQEGSCLRSTAGSLDHASWRPAGHLLSRSSATRGDRHEEKQQQSTRSTASSTASSPAVSKHVRTSCHHLGIGICSSSPKFSACGAEQVSKQVREQAIRFALEQQHESSRSRQQPHMENFFGLRPMQLACFYTTDQTCVFQHTGL